MLATFSAIMTVGSFEFALTTFRHHRGVDYAQAVGAPHAQLAVDHRILVIAHPTGTARVELGLHVVADEVVDLGGLSYLGALLARRFGPTLAS